ncbi:MAG: hypothetical protein PHX83_06960 [Acidobacteriia bacterium]|nr:hypothetical protein [Terriglobia bacterium]
MKTEKKMMTMAQFTEFAKSETDALLAKPNADRATVLKANFEKASKVEKADAEFEIEVLAEEPVPVDLTAINAKLDKIDAAVAAFASGVTAKAAFDAVVAKQGIAVSLAVELLSAKSAEGEYDIGAAVVAACDALGKSETPPDAAIVSEVGEAMKSAYAVKAEAAKSADEAAKKAAEEEAAKKAKEEEDAKKADTCEQCGAAMGGEDVCPECGWKKGTPVDKKAAKRSTAVGTYKDRYTGKADK